MAKRGRGKPQNRNKGGKPAFKQPLNFQDNAEISEYKKGERAELAAIRGDKHDNDPSWYVPSNTLLRNVASFPVDLKIGRPIPMEFQGQLSSYTNASVSAQSTPGILAYEVMPYVYAEGYASDPINLCGSALYTAMQVNSSRNPLYQANDLMLYLLAVTSAYSCLAWAERAYGSMTDNYDIMNDYMPGALVFAQGFNYEDLRGNLANFRTAINTFSYQLGSFYLPKDIDYVARQVFLYQGIYTDAETNKSQFYLYKPAAFLRWVEGSNGDESNPTLTYVEGIGEELVNVTVQQWIEIMESLVNPLRQSDDIRLMASDLIKAFGLASSYQLTPIAETFRVSPVYNKEVLMQFENAFILPPISRGENGGYTLQYVQSTDLNRDTISANFSYATPDRSSEGGTWCPTSSSGSGMTAARLVETINACLPNEVLMNFHSMEVSPEDMMVASRIAANPFNGANATINQNKHTITLSGFARSGSELIVGAKMYYNSRERVSNGTSGYLHYNISTVMFTNYHTTADMLGGYRAINNIIALLDTWDWHPKILFGECVQVSDSELDFHRGSFIYDLETWVKLSLDEWDSMNRIAMYGLFECTLGEVPRLR